MERSTDMQIAHAAIYTENLENLKEFYCRWFGGKAGKKYENPNKGFSSYFVTFDSGAALELMSSSKGLNNAPRAELSTGYSHLAFSTDSKENVENLTVRLRKAGIPVVSGPRTTGDGYFESCILDPDGNRVEITVG